MPEFKLKDRDGKERTYNRDVITVPDANGERLPFSYGEAISEVPVELDFTSGDMNINAGEGFLVKSAILKKPADLAPENVRYGKNIGGIDGTFLGDTEEITVDGDTELDFSEGDFVISPSSAAKVMSKATITKPSNLIPENIADGQIVAGILGTHKGGGGGTDVEGAVTVTFCNYDGTELFPRLVFVGDDCPDPITQGKIDEPTRESTAQYNYAYSGWSLTAGGTASASALKAVTEDRIVYAAFVANVRYYTARFYDGTTLMQESQVAYGSKATPPDTFKTGYEFAGWTPSNLTIYSDTDFYGTWSILTSWRNVTTIVGANSFPEPKLYLAYSPVGDRLFVATAANTLLTYDTSTKPYTEITTVKLSFSKGINSVSPSQNGKYLCIKTEENILRVYDTTTTPYTTVKSFTLTGGSVGYAFNNGGNLFMFCDYSASAPTTEVYSVIDNQFTLIKTLNYSFTNGNRRCSFNADDTECYIGVASTEKTYIGVIGLDLKNDYAPFDVIPTDTINGTAYNIRTAKNRDILALQTNAEPYAYVFDTSTKPFTLIDTIELSRSPTWFEFDSSGEKLLIWSYTGQLTQGLFEIYDVHGVPFKKEEINGMYVGFMEYTASISPNGKYAAIAFTTVENSAFVYKANVYACE